MFFPKKSLTDLEKRYEHSHALFTSHNKTIVDRLASIANRNILYVSIHDEYEARYDKIKDEYLSPVSSTVNSLRGMVEEKNMKGFKSLFEPARSMVANFENEVKNLTRDLEKIMKPEDDARTSAYSIKEDIRRLRESYRLRQGELSLIEKSFERLFNNVDATLKRIDDLIEIADYAESLTLIEKLKRLGRQVEGVIFEAPTLCVMIERLVPEKIKALREESERMVKKGYPIHHLMLNITIDKITDELALLTGQIANLDVNGIHDRLQTSIEKIEGFYARFEEEKEAKAVFEKDYQITYNRVNEIERSFIRLNSTLPQIKQYYVIGPQQAANIETIRQSISKINMTKRGLDTLVLSATKQPYSLQVGIIKNLQNETANAVAMIEEFNRYLASLKTKSDEAYQLVNVYYGKFKEGEHKVADLNIEAITSEIQPLFDDFYESLRIVHETLKVLPIDIEVIDAQVKHLKGDGETLLLRIEQEVKTALLAESAIVLANRDRHRLTDYHRVLSAAESSFEAGSFQQAYLEAGNLLKKIAAQLERTR
ncbi:MAG: septation ring formation regulator EzrA [Bacilli bacterium]|jgi:septation ring formation regulator EzrA